MDPAEEADNVIWLSAAFETAKEQALAEAVRHYIEELAVTKRAAIREHRAFLEVKRELDNERDQATDRADVRGCLEFWRDTTKRPKTTRIDLTTGRAKHVRWVCKHKPWGPRGFCIAVVGIVHTPWFVQHRKTDVEHIVGYNRGCYSEARFEEFLNRGRRVLKVER